MLGTCWRSVASLAAVQGSCRDQFEWGGSLDNSSHFVACSQRVCAEILVLAM